LPVQSPSLPPSAHNLILTHARNHASHVPSPSPNQRKKTQPPYARSPASDGEEECAGGHRPELVASELVASEPIASEPVASETVAAKPVASEGGASKRGASVNWASLKADGPLHKTGDCLLANEEYVDTYSALRQVCINWRSDLPEPDMHLHEWIMVEHTLPCTAEFSFLHLRTSRYVTIDLTEVHARLKFLHIYRVNLFLFSIVDILVLNIIFINIF
jgi:hypothetical protein